MMTRVCLCVPGAREVVFFRGCRVGGFVDSGPRMPMPSAFIRSTRKWTPADSGGLPRAGTSSPPSWVLSAHAVGGEEGTRAQRGEERWVPAASAICVRRGRMTTSPPPRFAQVPFLSPAARRRGRMSGGGGRMSDIRGDEQWAPKRMLAGRGCRGFRDWEASDADGIGIRPVHALGLFGTLWDVVLVTRAHTITLRGCAGRVAGIG